MMSERIPDDQGPRIVIDAMSRESFLSEFEMLDPNEREMIIRSLSVNNAELRRRHKELILKANQESREIESIKMHDVIKRSYRRGGILYLPSEEVIREKHSAAMLRLLVNYSNNIRQFGDDAVAHICPSSHEFTWLREGVSIEGYPRYIVQGPFVIDTITQLETLLSKSPQKGPPSHIWRRANGHGKSLPRYNVQEKFNEWKEERQPA